MRATSFQQLAQQFCETVRLSAPDWIFLDDEAYGEGWPVWRAEVAQSANAQARRLPGEADAQLAFLARRNLVHAVLSDDSDLVAYSCPRVLFKLDRLRPEAMLVERAALARAQCCQWPRCSGAGSRHDPPENHLSLIPCRSTP